MNLGERISVHSKVLKTHDIICGIWVFYAWAFCLGWGFIAFLKVIKESVINFIKHYSNTQGLIGPQDFKRRQKEISTAWLSTIWCALSWASTRGCCAVHQTQVASPTGQTSWGVAPRLHRQTYCSNHFTKALSSGYLFASVWIWNVIQRPMY